MEDLFNLNPDNFSSKTGQTRKVDEDLFNPGPDQGQNGVYKAIIRFIPWAADPANSKYKKYSAKLTNPLTNERLFVDCPSTTGAPSILWSLDTALKNLKDSEPQIVEEIRKYFNRYYNYYSLIYIKRDPQIETNEGKIKVYSFGYGIDNLIQQELHPESDLVVEQSINPYSLTEGKDFVLVVKRKTKSWRDYSGSKFMKEVSPLIISQDGKEIPVSTDPKVAKFATKFLQDNSPDLSKYFLKEWTDEDYFKIAEFIKAIVPYKQILDDLDIRDPKMKALFEKTPSRASTSNKEDLEFTPAAKSQQQSENLSVDLPEDDLLDDKPISPTQTKKANSSRTSEVDDLLADM